MSVHPGRHRSEGAKPADEILALGLWHLTGEPLEQDDVALAQPGRRELRHPAAVIHSDGMRGLDYIVLAERVDPVELGLDLRCRVVTRPVTGSSMRYVQFSETLISRTVESASRP
jgi:hypothetical protein